MPATRRGVSHGDDEDDGSMLMQGRYSDAPSRVPLEMESGSLGGSRQRQQKKAFGIGADDDNDKDDENDHLPLVGNEHSSSAGIGKLSLFDKIRLGAELARAWCPLFVASFLLIFILLAAILWIPPHRHHPQPKEPHNDATTIHQQPGIPSPVVPAVPTIVATPPTANGASAPKDSSQGMQSDPATAPVAAPVMEGAPSPVVPVPAEPAPSPVVPAAPAQSPFVPVPGTTPGAPTLSGGSASFPGSDPSMAINPHVWDAGGGQNPPPSMVSGHSILPPSTPDEQPPPSAQSQQWQQQQQQQQQVPVVVAPGMYPATTPSVSGGSAQTPTLASATIAIPGQQQQEGQNATTPLGPGGQVPPGGQAQQQGVPANNVPPGMWNNPNNEQQPPSTDQETTVTIPIPPVPQGMSSQDIPVGLPPSMWNNNDPLAGGQGGTGGGMPGGEQPFSGGTVPGGEQPYSGGTMPGGQQPYNGGTMPGGVVTPQQPPYNNNVPVVDPASAASPSSSPSLFQCDPSNPTWWTQLQQEVRQQTGTTLCHVQKTFDPTSGKCYCRNPVVSVQGDVADPTGDFTRVPHNPVWNQAEARNENWANLAAQPDARPLDVVMLGDSIFERFVGTTAGNYNTNLEPTHQVFQQLFNQSSPPAAAPTSSSLTSSWLRSNPAPAPAPLNDSLHGMVLAIAGDGLVDLQFRLRHGELPDGLDPAVWWILIGTNDYGMAGCRAESIVVGHFVLVQYLQKMRPNARIVLNSLLPRRNGGQDNLLEDPSWHVLSNVNSMLECFASSQRNVDFFNATELFLDESKLATERGMYADAVHPSVGGATALGQAIAQRVQEIRQEQQSENSNGAGGP